MPRTMQWYLDKYGESHQNATNKLIHWVCVPAILFSILALLFAIPFPGGRTWLGNWAAVVLGLALLYYIRLSLPLALGFFGVCAAALFGIHAVYDAVGQEAGSLAQVAFGIFAAAWVGQFIGHKIEGKKPSFLQDVQFLLIGPAWLLHFVYKKLGLRY